MRGLTSARVSVADVYACFFATIASDEPVSPIVSAAVTPEDKARARKIRKDGAKLDLGAIARSSAAVVRVFVARRAPRRVLIVVF